MPDDEITIRDYADSDVAEMRRLGRAFGDFVKNILPGDLYKFDAPAEGGFEPWLKSTQKPDRRLLVADAGEGHLAGYILGTVQDEPGQLIDKWGYVDDLFIDEEYRRQGLGGRLMREVEAWFKSRGCGAVAVDSWLANPGASKAYEALGFVANYTGFVRQI
jgi:GNAT superfamily N-acetyltransferase